MKTEKNYRINLLQIFSIFKFHYNSIFKALHLRRKGSIAFQFDYLIAPLLIRFIHRGLHSLRSFTHGYSVITPSG